MSTSKKILLINFGGIGDEILFLPVISALKEKYPNSKITLCLEPRSRNIVDLCDKIDNLILTDIKLKYKFFELMKFYFKALFGNFDIVISSGANKFIALLLFLTGIKTRIGYNSGKLSEKLLTQAVKLDNQRYAGKMYFELVKDLTKAEYRDPEINMKSATSAQDMVLIHPGVSKMSIRKNIIKSYSVEKWTELVEMLLTQGYNVALAGGPDDNECITKILRKINKEKFPNFHNFYGKTKNLKELAELMSTAKVVICCDSAPMHIAIALGVKTIAMFGPTDENKLIPQKDNVHIIKNHQCECRPCLWDKRKYSCDTKECLLFSNEEIINLLKN